MTGPLVALRDVFCVHRTAEGDAAALQGTTLDIAPGEIVCVLGPSGAGKSTMLRVIAGLQTPSAGIASVFGSDIGRLSERARGRLRQDRIGFMGQRAEALLAPDLRVGQAAELPLALRGVKLAERRRRVAGLLQAVGLSDRAGALPAELSGGERQRVALCAALAHRPALLLADEPTGELDPASAASVRALIVELARAQGVTVIMVTHDPASAAVADRAVRIRDGRITEDRRNGDESLVVGRGGWLQLPAAMLAHAGIGDRARAHALAGRVIVTPASDSPDGDQLAVAAPPADRRHGRWEPAAVELRALSRRLGHGRSRRQILHELTLSLVPGRLTAVTGRSGSGKTTLLRLLAGLERPDSGAIEIDGRSLSELDPEALAALRRERIGYLPQEPAPVAFLSATENVVLTLRVRGWSAPAAAERTTTVLGSVGLVDRARQRVARLSAGEAQRVALARALAGGRGLLLLDEPTSRLDQANAGIVAELLAAAAARDGQTIVCATHDPEVIRQADHVVEL